MMNLAKIHRVWWGVAALVVVGAGTGIVMSVKSHAANQPAHPAAVPALTVTATAPHEVSWPVTLSAWGAVAAWQEASIGAQVGGYSLVDVRVNVGDTVERGQVLARLDPDQLRTQVAQLKAALAQAQANAAQAQANRQRILSLRDSGGISQQDVLQYVTLAETGKAQVDVAQAQLAEKELLLRDTDVVAPDSGTISARTATLGAVVSVGEELFRMIRQNRLEWRGELTAAQMAQVQLGQLIHLALPDGSSAEARVRQIAPSLDATSRLGMIYADLSGASHARAGMYANGQLLLAQRPALVVPAASVVIRDGNSNVLTLQDDSATPKVNLRPVTVGRRQGDEIEIVQGLSLSSRVVVQGAGFLNDGNVVRVVAAKTGGA